MTSIALVRELRLLRPFMVSNNCGTCDFICNPGNVYVYVNVLTLS